MLLLISSLFCQKAALAIPTLAVISSSLLASSVIQLSRYLKRVTCSKGTLFNVIHRCIPFGFAVPFIIITFVFFTLISIPYALHVLFSLSIIFCIFSLVCHQYRIISISQIRNIDSIEFDTLYFFQGFLYHKRTVQVKEHGSYHTTLSYIPLYPIFLTNFAIPSNRRMLSPVKIYD